MIADDTFADMFPPQINDRIHYSLSIVLHNQRRCWIVDYNAMSYHIILSQKYMLICNMRTFQTNRTRTALDVSYYSIIIQYVRIFPAQNAQIGDVFAPSKRHTNNAFKRIPNITFATTLIARCFFCLCFFACCCGGANALVHMLRMANMFWHPQYPARIVCICLNVEMQRSICLPHGCLAQLCPKCSPKDKLCVLTRNPQPRQ